VTIRLCRPAVGSGSVGVSNAANYLCVVPPDDQAIFCRRRHQPRRPPLAKIRPGRPAPAMGPGTGDKGRDKTPVPSKSTEVVVQTSCSGSSMQSLPAIRCDALLNTAFMLRVA
jgi:hypothetical protein